MEDDSYNNSNPNIGLPVFCSGRINRYFQTAKNVACDSVYGKIRHGAVLVKGGSVINTACNKDHFNSFADRFRPHDCGPATKHAEVHCILGLTKQQTAGADMFVCRINRRGDFRMSKPCMMCHIALKNAGIKRVFYTTNYGGIEMYKL